MLPLQIQVPCKRLGAYFPCKCWLLWRLFSGTHGAGWLLTGMLMEGTARFVVIPQALQGLRSPLIGSEAGI